MYCSKCAYELSEEEIKKIEAKAVKSGATNEGEKVYVCPRCGQIIRHGLDNADLKSLSQAAHSEVHRAHNFKNSGMCSLSIGGILLIISIIFLVIAFKPANNHQLDTSAIEFYVFIILFAIAAACILFAAYSLTRGITKMKKYNKLIKDIQNQTFVQ